MKVLKTQIKSVEIDVFYHFKMAMEKYYLPWSFFSAVEIFLLCSTDFVKVYISVREEVLSRIFLFIYLPNKIYVQLP
jgi:hypothetical protein